MQALIIVWKRAERCAIVKGEGSQATPLGPASPALGPPTERPVGGSRPEPHRLSERSQVASFALVGPRPTTRESSNAPATSPFAD